jgi:isopenicillin N synthase-like dioxygenase
VISRAWDVAKQIFEVSADDKEKVNVARNNSNRGYFNSSGYAELNKDPNGVSIRDSKVLMF